MRIAVIGNPNFTTGFRLAGVDEYREVRDENKEAELDDAVEDIMSKEDVGIVVMHQDDLDYLSRQVRENAENSIDPTLVTLGGEEGRSGLRQKIKQAIGIDLMS
ncbi:MAG: V-type ATP synthase subunit F [Halobacteria archaeon]|nr:V-type ATP synthase subunit F [Halobacteria archaeon]